MTKVRVLAFTLMQMLLVIGIIILLIALIFPVILRARSASYKSNCGQQLAQIGVALAVYREEYGTLPRHHGWVTSLRILAINGFVSMELLFCPADGLGVYASRFAACGGQGTEFPISYLTIFWWDDRLWKQIQKADPNHGLVACRLHGYRTEWYGEGLRDFCREWAFMFEGPLLRLRKDGSVESATFHLGRNPSQGAPGMVEPRFTYWYLFTDAPDPWGFRNP
ncbi:MAG: hypothetical protein K6T17_03565 [Fimbriimonadales bacterium]|nr:hypothetical protein [Fimbriimonadales bacterium]